MKLYNALFKAHLSYCISSWGGISPYKLSSIFALQKRCVRLLFGTTPTYDHATYYETCARVRTYEENMKDRDFSLEHTKPIFNEHKILTLHHLYIQHSAVELFKIMKYKIPISVYSMFPCQPGASRASSNTFRMRVPNISLEKSRQNFVFRSVSIWNNIVNDIFIKPKPNESGIIVPGAELCTDILFTPLASVKKNLKSKFLHLQSMPIIQSNPDEWYPDNFFGI